MNETTENFLKVMAAFQWPDPKPIEYRLYYNDDGTPKCYSMEDLAGKYILVDRETYVSHIWNVKVVDEKLLVIPLATRVNKLQPNSDTGTSCHPQDICVIVGQNDPHTKWAKTTNEAY